jgi:hypothetical protein
VRDFQELLLVVGAAALGAVLPGVAVLYWSLGQPNPPGLAGAAAGALVMTLFAAGAASGAVVGLVVAVLWIRKHRSEPWEFRIWVGVALGLLTGLGLHVLGRAAVPQPGLGRFASWPFVLVRGALRSVPRCPELLEVVAFRPIAIVLAAALGLLGGLAARFAGSRRPGGGPRWTTTTR